MTRSLLKTLNVIIGQNRFRILVRYIGHLFCDKKTSHTAGVFFIKWLHPTAAWICYRSATEMDMWDCWSFTCYYS